jgi:hypothetical protein
MEGPGETRERGCGSIREIETVFFIFPSHESAGEGEGEGTRPPCPPPAASRQASPADFSYALTNVKMFRCDAVNRGRCEPFRAHRVGLMTSQVISPLYGVSGGR